MKHTISLKEIEVEWKAFTDKCFKIFLDRNLDYAETMDCLANFRQQAQLEGKSMFEIALQYLNGKVVRINMRGKTAKDDNFIDLCTYTFICYILKDIK